MDPSHLLFCLLLIPAAMAGGVAPLFAGRFRDRGLHLLVAVSAGLVLGAFVFHVVPEFAAGAGTNTGGAWSGVGVGFALMAAWGIHRARKRDASSDPHARVWLSAMSGMAFHSLTAGIGLALFFKTGADPALLLAPMLWHKATEGFSLGSLLQLSGKGPWRTLGYLFLFGLVTPLGIVLGNVGIGDGLGFTAGLAAGSFLYVVFFDFLPEAFHGEGRRSMRAAALALGLLLGAVGFGEGGGHGHGHEHAHAGGAGAVLGAGWEVLTQMAPWLLGGFLIAGVLSQVMDAKRIGGWLGGGGIKSVAIAAFLGAPLPLCSCSVLPVAASLRKGGASRGATSSFLIATPETGVDSISVTWGLLGPVMAVARLVSSLVTAIVTGFAVALTPEAEEVADESALPSCCMHPPEEPAPVEDCCSVNEPEAKPSFVRRVFSYAYIDMMDDLAETLLLGLALAALAAALLPADLLGSAVMTGLGGYVLMLLIGVPLYVCASASTPIAAALLAKGLSPGAALVFLLAGPATNLATLAVLRKTLGARAAVVHISVLSVTTLALGWIVDQWVFRGEGLGFLAGAGAHEHAGEGVNLLGSGAAILLLGLIVAALLRGSKGGASAQPAA